MKTLPRIFLDIDNTLITPKTTISSRNKKAVLDYIKAGGNIHLITGKVPYAIYDLVNELELDELIHAGANGGILLFDNEEINLHALKNDAKEVTDYLKANNIPYFVYYKDKTAYSHDDVNKDHVYAIEALNEPPVSFESNHDFDNLIKVLVFKDKDEAFEIQANEMIKDLEKVELVRTASYLYEFLNTGMRKSNAVAYINDDGNYTIAVGDSENDISMLQAVDKAYVVANASDDLKAYGFEVLPSCSDDGVAFLIEKLLKEQGVTNE